MRFLSSARARQRGVAVILAVLSLLILGVLATGFIVSSITENRMSLNEIQATSALQLADGGARAAYQWLGNQLDPPCTPGATITPLGTVNMGAAGSAVPTITVADTNDCTNDYQGWGYTIRSVGATAMGGRQAVVEMKAIMQRKNLTCYAIYLGDYCPPPAGTSWFADYDRVTGPVHSNCSLWLWQQDPPSWTGAQFWGEVSIVAPFFRLGGVAHYTPGQPQCYASFYDGYEVGVEPHVWPPSLAGTISCGGAHGDYTITGETWLVFQPDGTVDIKNDHNQPFRDAFPAFVNMPNPGGALGGMIRVRGPAATNPDIHIEGTYAGKWILICQRDIYFWNDLMPLHDPRFGPSNDVMGIIPAEQAVGLEGQAVIPDVLPGVDGDRQIGAYVMVPQQLGSWVVVDYLTRAREGILFLMGGISFGYLGPTESPDFQHGYGTDLWYDRRACEGNNPPPCLPELVSQNGNRPIWNIAQIDSTWHEVW